MVARIYRPAKNAMQTGRRNSEHWLLVYDPEVPTSVEPLMGYTSSADMNRQIRLTFPTREQAIAYAERKGLAYRVDREHDRHTPAVSYSDNFSASRPTPWTH